MAKILVTLKDPDVLHDSIAEHVTNELAASELPDDEQDALREVRIDKYSKILEDWFEWGEYVTLEFDTDAKTARVLTNEEAKQ